MPDTYIAGDGTVCDQIGVILSDDPSKIGVVEGDIALLIVETETYVGNDGYPRTALPVFYPGTDTYEDAAGNIHAVTTIGPVATVDFTGWSAGSQAGVYTDGVTGGKFPTGMGVNLGSGDLVIEITQATHDEAGTEAITFTISNPSDPALFQLTVPQQPTTDGETWRLAARALADGDAELTDFGIAAFTDADSIGVLYPMAQDFSLQSVQGDAAVGSTTVDGSFDFTMGAGDVEITLALKLDKVS